MIPVLFDGLRYFPRVQVAKSRVERMSVVNVRYQNSNQAIMIVTKEAATSPNDI